MLVLNAQIIMGTQFLQTKYTNDTHERADELISTL